MNWDDAETKLSNKPDGSFLVRDSSDDRYILSLSFRSQGSTHHTRIEHYKGECNVAHRCPNTWAYSTTRVSVMWHTGVHYMGIQYYKGECNVAHRCPLQGHAALKG